MFIEITVAKCDWCGKIRKPHETVDRRGNIERELPEGWQRSRVNDKFFLCQTCGEKLKNVKTLDERWHGV